MLVHVITWENRDLYARQLHDMHRMRRELFIDALGWSALKQRDGGEYDEYDDARAIYLLALDEFGHIKGGLRMRPTDDICLIADKFPHLIAPGEPLPKNPDVWEASRYMRAKECRGPGGRIVAAFIGAAAIELGLARGFTRFIGMFDTHFIPCIRRTGWRTRFLGLPAAYPEGECIAFEAEVSGDALDDACSRHGLPGPICVEHPRPPVPVRSENSPSTGP